MNHSIYQADYWDEAGGGQYMSDWNSALYLKFKKERTQPAADLAARLRTYSPEKIADIGCGPGNSTAVLRSVFPKAELCGIDASQNMIEKARQEHPELKFILCDINDIGSGYDLFFSNACLQWVPDHIRLLPHLMQKLNAGGVLAVQMPMNQEEPLYRIIAEVTGASKWGFPKTCFESNSVLSPDEYYDILSECSADFQIWETVYCHALPSHQALVDWAKSTRLRPYLDALDDEKAALLESEILHGVQEAYPVRRSGNVLLHFRRFFFTAVRQ